MEQCSNTSLTGLSLAKRKQQGTFTLLPLATLNTTMYLAAFMLCVLRNQTVSTSTKATKLCKLGYYALSRATKYSNGAQNPAHRQPVVELYYASRYSSLALAMQCYCCVGASSSDRLSYGASASILPMLLSYGSESRCTAIFFCIP